MIAGPKKIVADGYDCCADAYAGARASDVCPELTELLDRLPERPRILDVGCGAGLSVTAALASSGEVIGVDLSSEQIARARRNVASARFIHGDIMDQVFEPATLDAVVAFYSLFHLPRLEQDELLARVSHWLKPGGHLLATLARSDHEGYVEDDFFGVSMYWSHYQPERYLERLQVLGFEILCRGTLGHGYGDVRGRPPESHPIVLARAGGGSEV